MDGQPELNPEAKVAALERENAALRAANAKLMRERLGSANTAAAGKLAAADEPAAPVRTAMSRALGPLRKLRLWARKVLLRVLR